MYKYKFSVIIPIYNVENYLSEAIESVINQTIGFKDNIQLILINDGSTDNSEKICMEYKQKYPDNIIYKIQENAGVSSARNTGMQYIEGEYVNFLDGDDKWNLDAFEKVWDFFKNNSVKIVACRRKYFEAREDFPKLDYVFEKDRVIDIEADYQDIHLHGASTFFDEDLAKKYRFDSNLKYGEDAKFVTEMILEEKKFGVLRSSEYNYRKRNDKTSLMQNFISDIRWYNQTLDNYHQKVMELSIVKFGKIIPYVQYLLMYDIKGRINKEVPDVAQKDYIQKVLDIMQNIEDYIICEQKKYYATDKIFALSLKYGKDIAKELEYKDGKLYFNNLSIMSIKDNKSILKIEHFSIHKKTLTIEGKIKIPITNDQYEIYIQNNEQKVNMQIQEVKIDSDNIQMLEKDAKATNEANCFSIGRKKKFEYRYSVKIKLKKNNNLKFIFNFMNNKNETLSVDTSEFDIKEKQYKICFKDKEIYIRKYSIGKFLLNNL